MNIPFEAQLDDKGQIRIPSLIRKRLGLEPGMTLVVERGDEEGVNLRVEPEAPVLVNEDGILVVHATLLENIDDIVRIERDRRASLT